MPLTPQKYCTLATHSSWWCQRTHSWPCQPYSRVQHPSQSLQHLMFPLNLLWAQSPASSSLRVSAPSLKAHPDRRIATLHPGCSSLSVPGCLPSSLWLWPSINRRKPMGRMVIFGKAMMFALGKKSHQARSEKYFSFRSKITFLGAMWPEPNIKVIFFSKDQLVKLA